MNLCSGARASFLPGPSRDERIEYAADQTRAIARLFSQRQSHPAIVPRAALADSLALGYYRPPFQAFQFAASPTNRIAVISQFGTVDEVAAVRQQMPEGGML